MPSPEGIRRAVAVAALLVAAPLIVRDAAAGGYARPPVAAVPGVLTASSRALSAAAETALERRIFAPARDLAAAALARAPVDQAALRVLAVSSARSGDTARGTEALRLAAGLGWRDTPTQILLLLTALDQGDVAAATQRADALARREAQAELAFQALRGVAVRPGGRMLVVERLMARPRYRERFFADPASRTAANAAAVQDILAGLAGTVAAPSPAEVQPYVLGLMDRGALPQAREAWFRLAGTGGSAARALQDGEFARVSVQPNPFGWQLTAAGEERITIKPSPDRSGNILEVVPGDGLQALMSQHLLLAPGVHDLTVRVSYASDAARDATRWQLHCLPSTMVVLAGRPRLSPRDATGWQTATIGFDVSRSGCALQRLDLLTATSLQSGDRTTWFQRAAIR